MVSFVKPPQSDPVALQTLDAFLRETGLPPDSGSTRPDDWTIENILEQKKQYDSSLVYEKVPPKDQGQGWSMPGERCGAVRCGGQK